MKEIFGIRKTKDGKDMWDRIGVAFENKDNSLTLIFDYFPISRETRINLKDKKQ